ncbi:CMRF35-like molecule 1 [Stegastes partitus]|uniref:CMRF35-like molecule 1 n=1 Tax=Stegastes partitus TaxID=144197 RepID=A0A3B4ZRN8_9TELE|nr:PREDICTED: CMRF35-like molecule 1 [Stegastes partitus]
MAVHLSALLILAGLTGISCVTTIAEVSVKTDNSVTIPCLYDRQYRNNVKALCVGYYWISCKFAVRTDQPDRSGRFSISDDKTLNIFTVTMKQSANERMVYWCVVEIDRGSDRGEYFYLSATTGTPSLYVDNQEVTGFIGEAITISCRYSTAGEMKWCRLGKNCVTRPSGSIDGTRVTIVAQSSTVFTVTMSELKLTSSGWYWCAKGGFQMPVHVTVTEKPTTTTPPDTSDAGSTTIEANGQNESEVSASPPIDLKLLIIPLSLLVFIVIVALLVWAKLRHKQTKAQPSTTATANEEITYATVKPKKRKSNQTQEDATYSNVGFVRKKSSQKSNPESDAEVMYSSVVTIKKKNVKRDEAKDADVTYSTLAEYHRNI